jgi:hypothetical protein
MLGSKLKINPVNRTAFLALRRNNGRTLRLVRRFVFGKTDVSIDPKNAIGRLEFLENRLCFGQFVDEVLRKSLKRFFHALFIALSVDIKPFFVVVGCELLKEQ